MPLILGKAFNQHSPRGAEALLLCQEELISVLIRRSLLSLNITLGKSPAILSQITQLSSFSALHPRSPPSSSPTSLNSFPPPLFRLIFQSTINSLLITEVMEVVLPLLAPLLSFLCQYVWLQRPDPFRCRGTCDGPGEFASCSSLLPLLHPLLHPLFTAPSGVFVTFGQTFHSPLLSVFLFSIHP